MRGGGPVRRIGSEDRFGGSVAKATVFILLQTGEAGKPLPVLAVFGDVPRDYQLRFYGCKILYR